jgi:hypothetical protein
LRRAFLSRCIAFLVTHRLPIASPQKTPRTSKLNPQHIEPRLHCAGPWIQPRDIPTPQLSQPQPRPLRCSRPRAANPPPFSSVRPASALALRAPSIMNPHSPASSGGGGGYPSKRARHSPPDTSSPSSNLTHTASLTGPSPPDDPELPGPGAGPAAAAAGGGGGKAGQSSSFRNVSACNRCRLRKNRCDQRLPSCASCDKAGVKCVGYDPITKREIPRR